MFNKIGYFAAAGVGIGAALGWAFTADHYDRKLKQANAEIEKNKFDKVREYVEADVEMSLNLFKKTSKVEGNESTTTEKHEIVESTTIIEVSEAVPTTSPEKTEDGEEVSDGDPENTGGKEKIRKNLQALIDRYAADDASIEEFGDVVIEQMKLDKTPPFVISMEEYAWSENAEDHTKVTLRYFPSSRVVLDEDEDLIPDVANTVGWRNLQSFGDRSGNADTVYVRNNRILTDFEIVREFEEELPQHIRFGMSKTEYESKKAAGLLQ